MNRSFWTNRSQSALKADNVQGKLNRRSKQQQKNNKLTKTNAYKMNICIFILKFVANDLIHDILHMNADNYIKKNIRVMMMLMF